MHRPAFSSFSFCLRLLLLCLIGFSLFLGSSYAVSGGGFGGRSSSPAPSAPPSSSYGDGYSGSGGGGYSGGGPIIINNGGGYSSGGGSLGEGLFFVIVIGVVMVAMMRSMNAGTSGASATQSGALSVQIMMSQGDEVKAALQQIARNGDPDTDEGLTQMLQEAALVVLRHPERWTYGHLQTHSGSRQEVDAAVGRWSTLARSAFQHQTTSNYQNGDVNTGFQQRKDYTFQKEIGDLYLVVTVMVAAYDLPQMTDQTTKGVREALSTIASVTPRQLIRADVAWSPDAVGEFLTEDEAIMRYPQLSKL